MKSRITLFFQYLIFWYLLFVLDRVAFLLAYLPRTSALSMQEIAGTFWHGFKLDAGISAYIALIPSLLLSASALGKGRFVKWFYHGYTALVLLFVSAVIVGDLFLYSYWGFRIDATPLFYMGNLKAMTASVSLLVVIGGVLGVVLLSAGLFWLYYRIFNAGFERLSRKPAASLILLPLSLLLIVVMRGGLGIASLTTSNAYFSKNQFANHAAINPVWNVGFSITESSDMKRRYVYYDDRQLKSLMLPLRSGTGETRKLLRTDRPNIILIITESLTAKALAATGGDPKVMPCLNELVKEGILFDQIYASSDRTDKGIAAVLAAYPSLPGSSPLKYQKLTQKLSFLPERLSESGYRNEFYYGGTLEFANYRSFLVQAGYDKMVSDQDFPKSELKSKWGAFDHVVLNRCLAGSPDEDARFFKTILTLTSHEPFITPVPVAIPGDDIESKFLNSLHYTDAALGDFIRTARTRKWWDQTLVIIIADHGSRYPGNSEIWQASKYHIPMIWLGGALAVQDTVISNLGSQTDLASTLLNQLGLPAEGFPFSKNLLAANYLPYAFFTFNDGFGFLKSGDTLIYNTVTNRYSASGTIGKTPDEMQGKALLQSLYEDSFSKNK
jgi:phosphoglycerol transferase MdoB-like AlkP superfamily enzyme